MGSPGHHDIYGQKTAVTVPNVFLWEWIHLDACLFDLPLKIYIYKGIETPAKIIFTLALEL